MKNRKCNAETCPPPKERFPKLPNDPLGEMRERCERPVKNQKCYVETCPPPKERFPKLPTVPKPHALETIAYALQFGMVLQVNKFSGNDTEDSVPVSLVGQKPYTTVFFGSARVDEYYGQKGIMVEWRASFTEEMYQYLSSANKHVITGRCYHYTLVGLSTEMVHSEQWVWCGIDGLKFENEMSEISVKMFLRRIDAGDKIGKDDQTFPPFTFAPSYGTGLLMTEFEVLTDAPPPPPEVYVKKNERFNKL